jgi:hypothetical protein
LSRFAGPTAALHAGSTIRSLGLALAVLSLLRPAAFAQQTRSELLDQQRAERARQGPAPPRTLLEKWLLLAEEKFLQERTPPATSFSARFGGVVLGSGLGPGAGIRRSLFNDNVRLEASGLFTTRKYWAGRAEASLPRLFRRTVEVKGIAEVRHLPAEDFYGLGPLSQASERTNFLLDEADYTLQLRWKPQPWLLIGSQHAWLHPRAGRGRDGDFPSIEDRFTEATAPGSTIRTSFLEHGGLAMVDVRDQPAHPRRGGRYALYVSRYDDRHDRGFEFVRAAAQIEHYVPIFDGKRVVALRLALDHLGARDGSRVPFYYMQPFGGKDTLRGFDDLRYRDANVWLLTAEYRWEALSGLYLAVIYDRGGVAPRFRRLSIVDADHSFGGSVRVGTESAIFLRAEAAFRTREGGRFLVGFGGPLKFDRLLR